METTFVKMSRVAVTALTTFVVAQSALGQVLFSDDFQSYANDPALLTTWARVSGTDGTIFLAPDPLNAANQSIQQTTAAGRLRHVMAGGVSTAGNPLSFSFDLYDTTGATTSGRVYGEIRNAAAATGLLAAGIYNAVNTGTFDVTRYQARNVDNGAWIQLSALRSVGWHNFRFEILENTVSLYVDNVLQPEFAARTYSGNITYDWLHLGSGLAGNSAAFFDNVSLAVVPEPSTLALGLLGIGALLGRRSLRR